MRRPYILHGNYLTLEERRINPTGPHWINDPKLDAGDEAWIQKMLSLAGDVSQQAEKEEKGKEQSDSDLINDFIFHRGTFAE